ncbi:platelet glycoprotein Ib alpha chain-like [Mastomys coucha]|uniref:platelet glycoprotein Ib alpha chain-like n=1 Tax=Mastomys coucha TaxID=35658 RepID=UPI00126172CE|nr:platelet glycoprotein Ib alpha chain-like [Mastomys coucha]
MEFKSFFFLLLLQPGESHRIPPKPYSSKNLQRPYYYYHQDPRVYPIYGRVPHSSYILHRHPVQTPQISPSQQHTRYNICPPGTSIRMNPRRRPMFICYPNKQLIPDKTKPNQTTPAPTTNATTPAPTTNATTPAPTTNATTPAPTTNATTPAPTTNATTPAPTTNATTPAPTTNATTPAPTTNATTPAPTTNATTPVPTTNATNSANSTSTTTPSTTIQTTTPTFWQQLLQLFQSFIG